MHYIITVLLAILGFATCAQVDVVSYDYWFDSDYAGVTSTSISPTTNFNLTAAIPTTGLQDGLHAFHIRFEDDNGLYSSTESNFFFKSQFSGPSVKTMTEYEYWFDSDYASVVTTPMAGNVDETVSFPLDASALSNGLHTIHFRFKDSDDQWSSATSKFFFKSETTAALPSNEIHEYEYWFDSDYAGMTTVAVPNAQDVTILENIDASLLNNGLHTFHMRFKDAQQKWSSVTSKFFFKSETTVSASNSLTEYEYWFDSDYASAVATPIPNSVNVQTIEAIDATLLGNGLHTFHIRYLDEQGKWSSTKSKFFFKGTNDAVLGNNLTQYQFWFDADFASAVTTSFPAVTDIQTIESIDASALNNGLHVFNMRYMDEHGKWSSIKSKFFYHTDNVTTTPVLIAAYRHWFDSDFANNTQGIVSPAVADLNLVDVLDLTQIPHGEHVLHFQFQDDHGKWSSVTTDTVQKISYPIAEFGTISTMICIGDQVVFDNSSIDGDTHVWDFGDSGSSLDSAGVHIYNTPGVFDVTLTVADTLTGADSTIILSNYITVGNLANTSLTLNSNDSICPGEDVTIAAESGFTYAWNTTESTESILVSAAGDYYVTITDILNPSCETLSDTVTITLNPEPFVDLGQDLEQCGGVVILDANNPGDVYLWNDNSDQQALSVSATGEYSVEVTNMFGCTSSDTTFVTINAIPTIDLGPDVVQINPPVQLDAGAGFTQYDWSTLETSQTIQVNSNGDYWVEITDANGCVNSDTINVMFTLGIIEEIDVFFKAYPNPTMDKVTIQTSSFESELMLQLRDSNGKILFYDRMETEIIELDLTALPPGTYFIVFEKDGVGLSRIPIIKI